MGRREYICGDLIRMEFYRLVMNCVKRRKEGEIGETHGGGQGRRNQILMGGTASKANPGTFVWFFFATVRYSKN